MLFLFCEIAGFALISFTLLQNRAHFECQKYMVASCGPFDSDASFRVHTNLENLELSRNFEVSENVRKCEEMSIEVREL